MPIAKRFNNEIQLPQRTAKVIPETDVLIVGGGPAGIGAAMGAVAAGVRVILAEKYGFLGGNATAGLVLTLASYYTSIDNSETQKTSGTQLFPKVQIMGKPVIAGVLAKLVDRLVKANGAFQPSLETGFIVPFSAEVFKIEALSLLDSAGVELLFHSFASQVITDSNVLKGVVFETKSGPIAIQAKVIVDCTGDGDVAVFAGAPFEIGRDEDGLVQPITLMFLMSNFSKPNFDRYVSEHPKEWNGVQGLRTLMNEATSKGELNIPREDILFFGTIHENEVSVNSTRITEALGTDVWDQTRAEIEGRMQVSQLIHFFQNYVPGFEKAYLSQTGAKACVRESRRILGEYKLTGEDVLKTHKFNDVIAHGAYPIDIHNPKGKGTTIKQVRAGESYDIPLRCLLPLKIDNLLVAGRCISGTHEALASFRVMPISMATGQAAGVCAAIAVKNNQIPRAVNAQEVQSELIRQEAYLEVSTKNS
jgi:hypothetical protein